MSTRPEAKLPDPFRYRIPRSTKSLIFSHYGEELTHFDDVVDMIDQAEDQLTNEIKHRGWDEPIAKIRGWNLHTARLQVFNNAGGDGVTHKELVQFLWGLRESGMEFGFWNCDIEFYDSRFTISTRARVHLGLAPEPR